MLFSPSNKLCSSARRWISVLSSLPLRKYLHPLWSWSRISFHASAVTEPKAYDIVSHLHASHTSCQLQEVLFLFYNSPRQLQNQRVYAALFQACARHGDVWQGHHLHQYMLAHQNSYIHDIYISNHLINMYAKCGYLHYACQLLDEMPNKNVVSWTVVISGYAHSGLADECFHLLSGMLSHCKPNEFTLSAVLSSSNLVCGKQLHGLSFKMGLDSSVCVANALIAMYGKGSNHDRGNAWVVFKTMEFRNLISWNSMFQCCNLWEEARDLFALMHRDGIGFDRATMLGVLSSLRTGIDADVGPKICLQLHCLCVKSGFISEEVTTALVKAYSDCGGDVADCYKLFMEMDGCRDIISWTGIITVFAEHSPEKALFLFHQLRHEDLTPDWFTFSIILKACAGFVTVRYGSAIHAQVIKVGFDIDIVLSNALIHAYSRCGSVALSKQVFNEMGSRDVISWNSMLKAYALHSQAKDALLLFSKMDAKPDTSTFVALLSACSHSGLVEEGIRIFKSMSEDHGIVLQLDHYACMVDLLGRAGRIAEAMELIYKMPIEPDSVVWSALLGSCRKHGEVQLAQLAADKLRELEPDNSLSYVQMSNIYRKSGSFCKAGDEKREMNRCKVNKEPGLSWIEVRNKVHEFSSGGRHHPQRETIGKKLGNLIGQLREIGYVPETTLALHDVEEEQKEEHLFYHSEKLALVFGMMSGGCGGYGRNLMQIRKNIRICVDCHNFMKFASKLLEKEVVVRDSNRFHHFKDGLCSCNDYW